MSRYRRGFTLIELLVVIAIIAILAAILFPVFAQAKVAAKKSADLSNMKQVTLGVIMYAGDFDDVMPYGAYWEDIPTVGWRLKTWRYNTAPYIKNKDIFAPPHFPKGSASGNVQLDFNNVYEEARHGFPIGIAGIHSWAHTGYAPSGLNMTTIPRVANLIAVMTSRYQFADLGTWTITRDWYNPIQYPGKGAYVSYGGKANWGFYDGHAKSMNPCSTFGKLDWVLGDEPADDFLWEWWTGVDPGILRNWLQGGTPGAQSGDWGCQDIEEYR